MSTRISEQQVRTEIVAGERAALDRWGRGDPSGYLEISAPDVVYLDPFVAAPIHGRAALTEYYAALRGTIQITRDELRHVHVMLIENLALLTFQYFSEGSERTMAWNCSEVYRRDLEGWRIVQTHWSLLKGR